MRADLYYIECEHGHHHLLHFDNAAQTDWDRHKWLVDRGFWSKQPNDKLSRSINR